MTIKEKAIYIIKKIINNNIDDYIDDDDSQKEELKDIIYEIIDNLK